MFGLFNARFVGIILISLIAVVILPFGLWELIKYPWYLALNSIPQHPDLQRVDLAINPIGSFEDVPRASVHYIVNKSRQTKIISRSELTDYYSKKLPEKGWTVLPKANLYDNNWVSATKDHYELDLAVSVRIFSRYWLDHIACRNSHYPLGFTQKDQG